MSSRLSPCACRRPATTGAATNTRRSPTCCSHPCDRRAPPFARIDHDRASPAQGRPRWRRSRNRGVDRPRRERHSQAACRGRAAPARRTSSKCSCDPERGNALALAAAREAGESTVEEALLRSGAASVEGRLLVALRRDDSAEIEALKREGALSQSALERAIEYDDVESARALLSVGVDPNTPHSKGVGRVHANARTPAMLAALVDGGADLNAPAPAGTFQWSTAAWLCRRAASDPPSHWSEEEKAHPLAMLKLALACGMDVSSDGAAAA